MPPRDGPWCVLLVEDNPADAVLVQDLLDEHLDCRWVHVTRLDDALEALRDLDPEVVLLDVGLPDSRGLSTLASVREAAGDVPVVVLTGHDDPQDAAEAVRQGAQEYVSKQMINEELLVRVVRHSVERHRLLRQARRAEQRLRKVIDANQTGMAVLSADGRVLLANPAAETLMAPLAGPLAQRRLPFDASKLDPAGEELTVKLDGRGERTLEVRTTEIEWDSGAMLVSMRDVTDRREADQLRSQLMHTDRLRSIGELAAGVAHEINNPAALVLYNTETLSERLETLEGLVGELRELPARSAGAPRSAGRSTIDALLGAIEDGFAELHGLVAEDRAAILRIRAIVRSLGVFSRVESDHVETVRLHELVDDACSMVWNEIRHRARLERELLPVDPIDADPSRLTQVAVNLLVNAAQSITEGEPADNRVTVRTRCEGEELVFEVQDTGAGIPAKAQRRIFEPFYTTKPAGQGTGLGLALSLQIVEQHGGRVELQSEVGQGSLFRVRLPLRNGLRSSRAPEPLDASAPQRRAGRVLLIDDEEPLLRALRRVLEREHDVVCAAGGRAGIEQLQRDRGFDAIVCDLMMPDHDGTAVCRWIERHAPELLPRVVLMSGGAVTDRTRQFVADTNLPLLQKPVPPEELAATVQRVIGRR